MLAINHQQKIWLYTQPVDMRKSFNGLIAIAKQVLNENPLSGQLFVFINKRKTHMKILYFDQSGYCIWYKMLEQGQFNYGQHSASKIEFTQGQLQLLLDGIKVEKYRQYKRYSHPNV